MKSGGKQIHQQNLNFSSVKKQTKTALTIKRKQRQNDYQQPRKCKTRALLKTRNKYINRHCEIASGTHQSGPPEERVTSLHCCCQALDQFCGSCRSWLIVNLFQIARSSVKVDRQQKTFICGWDQRSAGFEQHTFRHGKKSLVQPLQKRGHK